MKYFRLVVLAFFLCSINVFSQDNNIKHSIVRGETISSIAQKYNVSIASVYKLNPKAKKTLQLNQVLLIPNSETKSISGSAVADSEKTTEINHQVLPKETLYGITKQFKTTEELLYKANPQLEKEGLKIGQTIIIPSSLTQKEIAYLSNSKNQEIVVTAVEKAASLSHEVKPKESLYVIAKMYGISLKELQHANPKIGKKGLSIGQTITIPNNGKKSENEAVAEEKKPEAKEVPVVESKESAVAAAESGTNEKAENTDSPIAASEIIHEVLPKETKYGIAKKYGITVAVLEKQNPVIQQKLLVGSKLSIQIPDNTLIQPSKVEIAESQTVKTKDTLNDASLSIANVDLINQIIQSASDKIGTRYRSGGTTIAGFDCSGFMYSTFGAFDIKLPRSSIEQSAIGEKIDDVNAQKGDLIFFKTNGRHHINHVGMVVEVADGEIKFIHSSTHSGVIISSTKEPYYERNFAQINRVVK
ncbi:LysM domain-containing protein [Flavobacterium sp. 1]|uniref:C40 family peptidase n=1 Tax=Flavobacterium sp. 1 TaxID=2035200 RepID=UPI000C24D1A5|nr:C40 family peptidase [Flavobacterium sp. 1]PJJ09151.1 LysM domain-containing protein [Flavobacterium sp. 1]